MVDDLYQEIILDHSKRPRNCHPMEDANRHAEGYNPLCGDKLELYVKVEDGIVKDVSFVGSGCAISTASASLMTESLKGKTREEAIKLLDKFHDLLTTDSPVTKDLGKLVVFCGVRDYPARVKCATLAWHTLKSALNNADETRDYRMTLNDKVVAALKRVYDPEMPVNIYDLGLIYGLEVDAAGLVSIRMTLTAPNCPVAGSLPASVEQAARAVSGVNDVKVELTFEPPWSKERMSEAARLALGIEDIIPVARLRK